MFSRRSLTSLVKAALERPPNVLSLSLELLRDRVGECVESRAEVRDWEVIR